MNAQRLCNVPDQDAGLAAHLHGLEVRSFVLLSGLKDSFHFPTSLKNEDDTEVFTGLYIPAIHEGCAIKEAITNFRVII